nr:protein-disulfide reductase DsbD [Gammaproteobacteria bacterium]
TSQGCADIGVCYPPQTKTLRVALPEPFAQKTAAVTQSTAASALDSLAQIGSTLDGLGDEDEFLEPDKAFPFSGWAEDGETLVATWSIAEGYYLYRDKFRFRLKNNGSAQLGPAQFPDGKIKDDPLFGKVEVFYGDLVVRLPISRKAGLTEVDLEAGFQGCAEAGICYPPMVRSISMELPESTGPGAVIAGSGPAVEAPPAAAVPVSEQDRLAALLASESRWLTVLSFFGVGLLLAFTPCVFPMIPILSGIIAGQGSDITTRKAFTLSVVYVLAMSLTYTVAGVVAGLFGKNLQAALQNEWMLGSFAAVFVLLALSMFGFYELQLPTRWQSKLTEVSNRQSGGSLIGVAVMGLLSALIVGPCVAPPLAGALIYIGQTGDPWLGGLALFALSLGMGTPLVGVGTLEGRFLPKAGGWMNAVKAVFGVLLLGVAVFLLERVLPGWVSLLLWAGLFMVSAIYLGALEPLGRDASGFRKLWKGTGLIMLVYGVLLMIGAASGGQDLFQPLRGVALAGGTTDTKQKLDFRPVKTVGALDAELVAAADRGQPVMLDFYADWCVECKRLEKSTFTDPGVQQALSGTTLLKADVTANDADDQALLKAYGLIGPPAILFFGPDGRERRPYRLVGFLAADEFRLHAQRAVN